MNDTSSKERGQMDAPGTQDEAVIRISRLNNWYGAYHARSDIDLTVRKGERIVICGPSGSGKSTLVRCINALEAHQSGTIDAVGTRLTDDMKDVGRIRAEVGMCFQQFNLFPHLTVLENCVLSPRWTRKQSKRDAEAEAMHFLEMVKIPEQANKYPDSFPVDNSSALLSHVRFA